MGANRKASVFIKGRYDTRKRVPKYKAITQNNTLGMPASKVVVTCLVVCITSTWWVYTGITSHVYNSLQGFQETQQLTEKEICLKDGRCYESGIGCSGRDNSTLRWR